MRLISAILRNYRIHRELKIEFDQSRTLIGGDNETGKSTLVEAIHRALFLKAKGNTESHREMTPTNGGNPEVELVFEISGIKYNLIKKFGGSGTVSFSSDRKPAVTGPEAETELASLLGVSGKSGQNQWAHLWVWQGKAGENPSVYASEKQIELFQQLQKLGAAAVLQSDLDNRMSEGFANIVDEIFTNSGKAKTASELYRSETELSDAEEALQVANARMQKLESAMQEMELAKRELPGIEKIQTDLQKELTLLEIREKEIVRLQKEEAAKLYDSRTATEKYNVLAQVNKSILKFDRDVQAMNNSLQPKIDQLSKLESSRDALKLESDKAEKEYREAVKDQQSARLLYDFAQAKRQQFESSETLKKLKEKEKSILKLSKELADTEEELSKLPKIDKSVFKKLQGLESALSEAKAVLHGMAAGLTVIKTDQNLSVGGHSIKEGEKLILTEDTELKIGKGILLRITPGGGTSLSEARQLEADAQKALDEKLNSTGVKGIQDALQVMSSRDELESKINSINTKLSVMDAEQLADELKNAHHDLTAAEARLERMKNQIPDNGIVIKNDEIKEYENTMRLACSASDKREAVARKQRDIKLEEWNSSTENFTQAKLVIDEEIRNHDNLKAQLVLLIETHGDNANRTQKLVEAESIRDNAEHTLKLTVEAISVLQPDMLELDKKRTMRALQQNSDRQTELQNQVINAKAILRSDGLEDPLEDLNKADLKLKRAKDNWTGINRKAQAFKMLDELFQNEQRTLSDQYTKPLAEKISGYLQCIFGAGTQAQIRFEDSEFSGLALRRAGYSGNTFNFEKLSGGSKEQVAAAVRLAMAEVLAAETDGCLPLVFDDAFAYSDPSRVAQLQRMLDLAAGKGLQIIVLSCNPVDYAGLGARQIILRDKQSAISQPQTDNDSVNENSSGFASESNHDFAQKSRINSSLDEEELKKQLIDRLTEMGGKAGNQSLRESLGWEEDVYDSIKDGLIETGSVLTGRGRGGSIILSDL